MSARAFYFTNEIADLLRITRRTFDRQRVAGLLPFLDEIRPRLGNKPRYRAEPVDRWLAGQWEAPRFFNATRRRA